MEPREIIRDARERHNWSQKDLADRAGVSQVAIVKIESGAGDWVSVEHDSVSFTVPRIGPYLRQNELV